MEEMDRRDFLNIVKHIKEKLVENGLADIADDANYTKSEEEGEYRLPSPQIHAVLLLEAFNRHLKANSRETLETALEKIRKYSNGEFPESVRVERLSRDDFEDTLVLDSDRSVDLTSAPKRDKLIASTKTLINEFLNPTEDFSHE